MHRSNIMARLARNVVPGVPHHVTRRGNGRLQTFFRDENNAHLSGVDDGVTVKAPADTRVPTCRIC